jgi:preprotein translocase subunit Sss1
MLDGPSIMSGVVAGAMTHSITTQMDGQSQSEECRLLTEISDRLAWIYKLLDKPDDKDIYKSVTLYQGAGFILLGNEGRDYIEILSNTALVLTVQTAIGYFSVTLTPNIYTYLPFPDDSIVTIASGPQSQNVWARYSTVRPPS